MVVCVKIKRLQPPPLEASQLHLGIGRPPPVSAREARVAVGGGAAGAIARGSLGLTDWHATRHTRNGARRRETACGPTSGLCAHSPTPFRAARPAPAARPDINSRHAEPVTSATRHAVGPLGASSHVTANRSCRGRATVHRRALSSQTISHHLPCLGVPLIRPTSGVGPRQTAP